jgi:hypothetical protein
MAFATFSMATFAAIAKGSIGHVIVSRRLIMIKRVIINLTNNIMYNIRNARYLAESSPAANGYESPGPFRLTISVAHLVPGEGR